MNSSVMKFNVAQFSYVWDEFSKTNVKERIRGYQGDQDFLQVTVRPEQRRFLDGDHFQSWRWQVADGGYDFARRRSREPGTGAKVGSSTDVLIFHGHPKPHQVHDPVVVNNWQWLDCKSAECYNSSMTNELNSFEVILIHEDMHRRGIVNYSMRPGNDCIWVSYGLVDAYYIFRDGKIADIQYDWPIIPILL